MTRHLLTILDLSREEIEHLLARARELKVLHTAGPKPRSPEGKNRGHDLRQALHPHPGLL